MGRRVRRARGSRRTCLTPGTTRRERTARACLGAIGFRGGEHAVRTLEARRATFGVTQPYRLRGYASCIGKPNRVSDGDRARVGVNPRSTAGTDA